MDAEATAAILAQLHPPLAPGQFLELRGVHHAGGMVARRWFRGERGLVKQAWDWAEGGMHTYFSLHPRAGKQAGDGACTTALCLPVDLDAKLWAGSMEAARNAVRAFFLDAALVVRTGGGLHVYYLLDAPLDLTREAGRYRALCNRVTRAIAGPERTPDLIGNPERVLRVPGSLNWKYDPPRRVEVERWRPEKAYDADALEAWLDAAAAWTRPAPPPERPIRPALPQNGVIEDFNERFDVLGLLARTGCAIGRERPGGVVWLRKPGGSSGSTHATYGYHPGILTVFSHDWPPFRGGHSYNHFQVFTLLEHGGDGKAAYAAARASGYGQVTLLCGRRTTYVTGAL